MREIDLSGKLCPTPLTYVNAEISRANSGEVLRIITDDFACFIMIKRLLALLKVKVLEEKSEGGRHVIIVEKLGV